jgi:intracellular septation protein
MAETPPPPNASSEPKSSVATAAHGAGNLWTDLGPVAAWFLTYNGVRRFPEDNGLLSHGNALYWATGVFMAATAVVIVWTLSKGRRLPPMLIITGVVVMVFGGLTLALQDKTFAFIKPTIINLLFAAVILGSLAIGRNIWKTAFEHAFQLPDFAWRVFALRWAGYYVVMAILNEIIWRNFSEDFWSNSKVFLTFPLFFLFMALNIPYLLKHQISDPGEPSAKG